MPQPLEALRWADEAAGATDVDFALLTHGFAAAFGAMVGEDVGWARLVARKIFDHLRDDVAGALDAHAVADAQAEPGDLVAVVERDIGDNDPADADWLEAPDRRELAGAAHLDADRPERGFRFLGGEFVRQRPARSARDLAQPLLPIQPPDFVDDAIDIVRQIGADALDLAIVRKHLLNIVAALQQVADRESEGFDL